MEHKILLLGCGFWGNFWLDALSANKRCSIAGIAGMEHELKAAAQKYRLDGTAMYTDFRKAIKECDATIAIVVIPAEYHCEADIMALKKGLHVITEKPLALNLEEAEKIRKAKEARPELKFMASQNYRWRPHNRAIKHAIDSGMIGKLETISVLFRQQEDLQGFRAKLEMPLLQDMCIHHFDLIRFFTSSDCERIYCSASRPSFSAFSGKPNTDAVVKMKNDVMVSYCGTWAARGKESSWDGNFLLTGSLGCLALDDDNQVFFYPHGKNETVKLASNQNVGIPVELPEMESTDMAFGLDLFMDCIEQNTVPPTDLMDNIESFKMVCGGIKSASDGVPVHL